MDVVCMYNAYLSLLRTLQAKTGSGEADLTFQTSLAGFATSIHVVTLVPSSPALRMNLQGQLAYIDALATNKRLFFDTPIPTSDFIRYCALVCTFKCRYMYMYWYMLILHSRYTCTCIYIQMSYQGSLAV